jgi:hypothetical protein
LPLAPDQRVDAAGVFGADGGEGFGDARAIGCGESRRERAGLAGRERDDGCGGGRHRGGHEAVHRLVVVATASAPEPGMLTSLGSPTSAESAFVK